MHSISTTTSISAIASLIALVHTPKLLKTSSSTWKTQKCLKKLEFDPLGHVVQAHKVFALTRLVDRFGEYLSHLIALSKDRNVKAVKAERPCVKMAKI